MKDNSVNNATTPAEPSVSSQTPVVQPVQAANNNVLKQFDGPDAKNGQSAEKNMLKKWLIPSFMIVGVVLLGIASGFGITLATGGNPQDLALSAVDKKVQIKTTKDGEIKKGTVEGLSDIAGKDTAVGVVKKGGIEGEGSHHLLRPGGESQTLYMTSSIIDLDKYIDKKVKVAGDTLGAQHAGWLMDVVNIEVL